MRRSLRRSRFALIPLAVVGLTAYWLGRAGPSKPSVPVATGDARTAIGAHGATPARPDGAGLTGTVVDGMGLAVAGVRIAVALEASSPAKAAKAVETATSADGRFALRGLPSGRYRISVSGAGLLSAELRYVAVPGDDARIVVFRRVAIDGTVTDGARLVGGATVAVLGDVLGGVLEVRADPKGAFRIPTLPEGRYQVYAWRADLAARAVRVTRLGAGPFAPVELRLEAGAVVVGTVIDRDEGTGIVAAVELRPSTGDSPPRYARTGPDGVFRIEGVPTGRWIADAFAPGYESLGGVELDAGKGTLQLVLERGAAIEGRVVDGAGKPIAGASVRAFSVAKEVQGRSAQIHPIEYSAAVDAARLRRFSGHHVAPAVEAGRSAGDPQLIARGELGVMVGPIPPLPPPGAPIASAASVVDPSSSSEHLLGEPPPLATDSDRASVWITGSDGRYRVQGIGRGKVRVVASAPGLAEAQSRTIAIDAAGSVVRNVDVVLSPGVFVIGTVKDHRGAPVIGAELSAQPEVGTAVVGFTGGDGRYRLGPLTGIAELRVAAFGYAEVRRKVDLSGISAATWTEDIAVEAADAVLAGTVVDAVGIPIAAAQLDIKASAGQKRHAVSGPNGAFTIDRLPRGPMRLAVTHPDYPPNEFEVVASPNSERVRLVLATGGAVEGAIIDARSGAPLAGLTLSATGPGGETAETSTDKAGRWHLGPVKAGHWRLSVKYPGYLSQTRQVDVPSASRLGATSLRDIRIDLARGALVGGTVRDGRGKRVAGAHVAISSPAGQAAGDSDANGEFRIHDAPTGDIVVQASRDNASGNVRATVPPGAEVLGLAIEIR